MAGISSLVTTWDTIKEVDLRPLRQQALRGVNIAIVGIPGSGRSTLAEQMRRDPARRQIETDTPVLVLDLDHAAQAASADLIILVVHSRRMGSAREQELVKDWYNAGKKVLVFINQFDTTPGEVAVSATPSRSSRRVLWGSVLDVDFLSGKFAAAVIDILPDHLLSLARHFPLFRVTAAHYMINDACFSNAAYALSTGLAETVAVMNIPIAMTDMLVLTKTQAFLVYKLGLALGYSTHWQDYISEFGSVLGGGFLWRQLARTLVGLVPVWGILPKTAISYAGTYVIGHGVLQWYLTGRHVSTMQMQQLYSQALARGKLVAARLIRLLPRPRLPKLGRLSLPRLRRPQLPRLKRPQLSRRASQPDLPPVRFCPDCGHSNAVDARFCQYCAKPLN